MQKTNVRTLFPMDPPTSEQAWEIVKRVPLDASIGQVYKRCKGACCRATKGHGPYWIARWTRADSNRQRERHIGSDDALEVVRAAHAVVRREIEIAEEAAQSPALRYLRELEARAYARGRPDGIVSVPIVDMKQRRAAGEV